MAVGNTPIVLSLAPTVPADKAKALARDGGNHFWLVIDVQASRNPQALFGVDLKVRKSVGNATPVQQSVQTFNVFNAGMHKRHGLGYKTAWQVEVTDLVRAARLDLTQPIEVTITPQGGDAAGAVTISRARIEAQ
jgi:hypothetical protein